MRVHGDDKCEKILFEDMIEPLHSFFRQPSFFFLPQCFSKAVGWKMPNDRIINHNALIASFRRLLGNHRGKKQRHLSESLHKLAAPGTLLIFFLNSLIFEHSLPFWCKLNWEMTRY